ncbi:hypothetical protein DSL72_006564 [Monilinia vaccinii-corymbosi]|uniref:DNA (cytosine-5-)-methyltransferase n=1 Tax=Monilinia vaccinii-corymbosi TaxID=61207 RepID=A0A8A3PNU1_9HELO|nr:hypothetical protein DSL72_006564 [Monilinia vaccinii-corymbosi]
MFQAIVIQDDDVVVVEDDDKDEVVLLERAPTLYKRPLSNSTAIKNRASSVPRDDGPRGSMLRTLSDSSADANNSANSPPIDLTPAVISGNPSSQDIIQSEDSTRCMSSNHLKSMPSHEGYEPLVPWNIAPETETADETPTHERRYFNASLISISDEECEEEINLAQVAPLRVEDNIILIEDDDFEFKLESQLLETPEFEFLRSVSVNENPKAQPKPKAVYPLRNPPITSPYFECGSYLHGKLELRPMKTVELEDGDFVYIKHIVIFEPEDKFRFRPETGQDHPVTIRGLRLQRCKYLNGMLEKKMNEVCLCYEIDLDDKREPEEQSLVEVPLSSVKALRSLRWTNHHYPKYRNLYRDIAGDSEDAYNTGGLTVRWKYTCTYASALARGQNIYAERILEQLTENWLSSVHRTSHTYLTSNAQLRMEWRGKTIAGGSYAPEYYEIEEEDDSMPEVQQPTIMKDTQSRPKPFIIAVDNVGASPSFESQSFGADGIQTKRKSDFSSSSDLDCDQEDSQPAKRVRQDSENDIEKIRQRLGQVMLSFDGVDYVEHSYNIETLPGTDLDSRIENNLVSVGEVLDTNSSVKGIWSNSGTMHKSDTPDSQYPYLEGDLLRAFSSTLSTDIPPQIDITSSELASPPPSGVIELPSSPHHSHSSSLATSNSSRILPPKEPRTRTPGQTFTYGDAFCGAGGTTRGAAMAGLRVKWGFDFDHQACKTWRLNFPHATCYEMSSERFVALATPSPYSSRIPDDVKVDILHLSPPCQYFSPAHTIEGKNDEMNTASLFAVAAVIKVAKPRVVTLEQTFGILYPRFRGYFHSLICMFTSCGFSLRWAIVPLAQWGLPQRRFRLIIIASCPGEPLPPMPPPTHSSPSSPLPNTRPFKTVYETLRKIPTSAANHPVHLMPKKYLKPYNSHAILPRTMTTSGGENWHPSGKRGFTDREFACLQGFPLQHRFGQTGAKRQIGNAVPPIVAKVLFEGIRRFMEGVDGIVRDDGGKDGDYEMGDGEIGDAMNICEDVEGVQIVDNDPEAEIIDLVGGSDGTDGEDDDDDIEIVKATDVVEYIVVD